jgi:hypothetical protein
MPLHRLLRSGSRWKLGLTALVASAGAGVLCAAAWVQRGEAADHLDPPARAGLEGDRAADIADVYVWHEGSGASASVVAILTFDGPNEPLSGQAVSCDRDVLYGFHFDTNMDNEPNLEIFARFGEDDVGNCFVRFESLPGLGGRHLEGPVELVLERGGVRAFAGLTEDPFFFDLQGFQETVMTGDLSFVNDRDFFANRNASALIIQFPLVSVSPTGQSFQMWATTERIGG